MALPNPDVITALFESYINIRKNTKNLDDTKIDTCIDLLIQVKKAKSFDDWIELIYVFWKEELEEIGRNQNKWFNKFKELVGHQYILWKTIHACLTYMISQLNPNPLDSTSQFEQVKNDLIKQKEDLQKSINDDTNHKVSSKDVLTKKQNKMSEIDRKIDALNKSRDYHSETYFPLIISALDPQATILKEKSFADFEENVKSVPKKRSFLECEKKLAERDKTNQTSTKLIEVKIPGPVAKKEEVNKQNVVENTRNTKTSYKKPPVPYSMLTPQSTFKPKRDQYDQNDERPRYHGHNLRSGG